MSAAASRLNASSDGFPVNCRCGGDVHRVDWQVSIAVWRAEKITFPKWAVEIVGVGLAVSGQDRIPCVAEGHRMVTVPDSVLLFRIVFGRALTKFKISTDRPAANAPSPTHVPRGGISASSTR